MEVPELIKLTLLWGSHRNTMAAGVSHAAPNKYPPCNDSYLSPWCNSYLKRAGVGWGAMIWTFRVPQNPMLKLNLKMMVLGGAFEERLGHKNGR